MDFSDHFDITLHTKEFKSQHGDHCSFRLLFKRSTYLKEKQSEEFQGADQHQHQLNALPPGD